MSTELVSELHNFIEQQNSILEDFDELSRLYTERSDKLNATTTALVILQGETELMKNELVELKDENARLLALLKQRQQTDAKAISDLQTNLKLRMENEELQIEVMNLQQAATASNEAYELTVQRLNKKNEETIRDYHDKVERLKDAHSNERTKLAEEIRQLKEEIQKQSEQLASAAKAKEASVKEITEKLLAERHTVAQKQSEIQKLRRELAEKDQQHAEALQRARMKYEEHLLEVTKKAGTGMGPDNAQVDVYRRKLVVQKQEYEGQLEALQQKIQNLEAQLNKRRKASDNKQAKEKTYMVIP